MIVNNVGYLGHKTPNHMQYRFHLTVKLTDSRKTVVKNRAIRGLFATSKPFYGHETYGYCGHKTPTTSLIYEGIMKNMGENDNGCRE